MRIYDRNGGILSRNSRACQFSVGMPPFTIRLRFMDGITPVFDKGTAVQVSSSPNVWDLTYRNNDWYELLSNQSCLLEVIDANTTGVTVMSGMFYSCDNLTSVHMFDTSAVTFMNSMFKDCHALTTVPLFDTSSATDMHNMFQDCIGLTTVPLLDTSSVTDMEMMFYECYNLTLVPLFDTASVTSMNSMFYRCYELTSVPLFDTSSTTDMNNMFDGCNNVQSGALALYQQASTQSIPPTYHNGTFTNCGRDTVTGAAELAQIPDDWK